MPDIPCSSGQTLCFCAARCRVLRKKFRQQDQQHCQNAYCRSKPCSALFPFTFPGKIFSRNLRTKCPLLLSFGVLLHFQYRCHAKLLLQICRDPALLCGCARRRETSHSTFSARTVCSVRVSVISSFTFCTKAPLTLCAKIRFQPFLRSLQERCLRTLMLTAAGAAAAALFSSSFICGASRKRTTRIYSPATAFYASARPACARQQRRDLRTDTGNAERRCRRLKCAALHPPPVIIKAQRPPSAVQKTVPLLLPCILPLRPCSQTAPDSAGSPQSRTEACILQGIANGAEAADTVAEIRPRSRQVPQNPDCFLSSCIPARNTSAVSLRACPITGTPPVNS